MRSLTQPVVGTSLSNQLRIWLSWLCTFDVDAPFPLRLCPAGSDVDAGNVAGWLRDARARVEGRRILVGGGAATVSCCFRGFAEPVLDEDVETSDDASSLSLSLSLVFSPSSLELGDELAPPFSSRCWASFSQLSPSSKSKIFPKFSPTLGERLNRLTSSAGEGVASISPVVVRTTPFIAEGI